MSKKLSCALIVSMLVFALAGCRGRSVLLQSTTPVALPTATDPTELRAALVRALTERRFTTEQDEPGRLVASLTHRGQQMRIAIAYSPTDYRIDYVDSAGMGYVVGRDGAPRIHRNYDRYVQRLRSSIEDEIGRPERERQEAIQAQRDHERELAEQARRAEQDRINAENQRAQNQRDHERDMARLQTQRAQAEAEARRPIIINHNPEVVTSLQVAPRARVRARFGATRVSARSRARWLEGQAEGNMPGTQMGIPGSCRGYFSGSPEHVLTVPRGLDFLRLETDGQGDPTLVVVASDGSVYCDDDGGEGLNSRIEGSFPAGTYRIYVGSYRANEAVPYRLLVTRERAAARTATVQAAPRQPAPRGPDCRQTVLQRGFSPSQMRHCEGAQPVCADALLNRGHNPSQLRHCRGVEPTCATVLLNRGHNPSQLRHCSGAEPSCARAVLENGNNPSQLRHCR